jgi:riboflavin kinase/FMN adenylyltransferase
LLIENVITLKIFNDISTFRAVNPVATIGIFDGVHMGHNKILERIRELAARYHGESVVITLWPHPRLILQPENTTLSLLTTLNEKIELIDKQGIDNLIILPFTRELSNLPFDQFIRKILIRQLGIYHLVVGFNHHFGKDRMGSYELLQKHAIKNHFRVEKMDPVIIRENRVSSSRIRNMLLKGRISTANELLGYPYFIHGTVVKGNRAGTAIGFPTANIKPGDPLKLIPMNGVYAAYVTVDGKEYPGMLNIGVRPTMKLTHHEQTIEVHLFNFNRNIYGSPIRVRLYEWLRCEKKFATEYSLKIRYT